MTADEGGLHPSQAAFSPLCLDPFIAAEDVDNHIPVLLLVPREICDAAFLLKANATQQAINWLVILVYLTVDLCNRVVAEQGSYEETGTDNRAFSTPFRRYVSSMDFREEVHLTSWP